MELLSGRVLAILTGAGISTDSGIPDYRGPEGSMRKRNPIPYREFVGSESGRRRYWARSTVGWPRAGIARPNAAHLALARLEEDGLLTGLITQNVDGLHQQAGSASVIELHGSLSSVVCLECGARESRRDLQTRLEALNPGWQERRAEIAPDGDAELPASLTETFVVPTCLACGGVLKPDVVFFGENVPGEVVTRAFAVVDKAQALLIAGTSLAVYSGYRFLDRAVRNGIPVVIVNVGDVRGADQATLHLQAPLSDTLPRLAEALAHGPRQV